MASLRRSLKLQLAPGLLERVALPAVPAGAAVLEMPGSGVSRVVSMAAGAVELPGTVAAISPVVPVVPWVNVPRVHAVRVVASVKRLSFSKWGSRMRQVVRNAVRELRLLVVHFEMPVALLGSGTGPGPALIFRTALNLLPEAIYRRLVLLRDPVRVAVEPPSSVVLCAPSPRRNGHSASIYDATHLDPHLVAR